MAKTETVGAQPPTKVSLIKRIAHRFNVDDDKLLSTLKSTAFRQKPDAPEITNEQMMALLVVSDQYGLNPFTKEIYAYPDKGGIVPVVGVDGWSRIINEHKNFDGMDFKYSETLIKMEGAKVTCHEWIEVTIHRNDRTKPTIIREYLDEVYKKPYKGSGNNGPYTVDGPWQTHPKRFLRHKGIIQCGRIALGFTGIYDQDEADRIIDMGAAIVVPGGSNGLTSSGQPLAIDRNRIDPVMDKLIEQAKQLNSWGVANQYVMQNFQGPDVAYALNLLRDAEIDNMPSMVQRSVEDPSEASPTVIVGEERNGNSMNSGQPPIEDDGQPSFFN
ncbi:phage recombination protein Bet [Eoetvoesiella caeni]